MNQSVRVSTPPIPFIDVVAQRRRLGRAIDDAIDARHHALSVHSGAGGRALESELAAFCGARHVVGCASGTDALMLVLMAKGDRSGRCGDVPVLHLLRHGRSCRSARAPRRCLPMSMPRRSISIRPALKRGSRPPGARAQAEGVDPVDLFGLPADHDAIRAVAQSEGLFVLDDAAQAFGADYKGRKIGTLALGHRDELLSGQAARLLRRRRRDDHRRSPNSSKSSEPSRARAGQPTNTTTSASA